MPGNFRTDFDAGTQAEDACLEGDLVGRDGIPRDAVGDWLLSLANGQSVLHTWKHREDTLLASGKLDRSVRIDRERT